MSKKLNFIFVGLQRIFTDRESTATSIAKQLAKEHNVLYVNSPIDRRSYLLGSSDQFVNQHITRIKHKTETLEKVGNSLWVLYPKCIIESINWIPNTMLFSLLNKINNQRFAKEIKETIKYLKFRDYIIVNDKDIFRSFYLKEILKPMKYVYLDRDYIIGMDYWKRHGSVLEPLLMQKSDIILCNSHGFRQRALKQNPKSYYIGNGCNIEHFDYRNTYSIPHDLMGLTDKPIVGYVGALLEIRLDIDLLLYLAELRPEWNFVLVGREDIVFQNSKLHAFDNVYFLGQKDTALTPAYINYFDVCINPQLINEITNDNYPLKIDEYLAMGKPVVAMETNVMREVFSSVTYLATNYHDFLVQIEKALNIGDEAEQHRRIMLAHSHSWSSIVERVLDIIEKDCA
ncbi:glycosyltransferase [Parapedobacter soli]|uniref:glycosyltransferase n=1 Tax=Parapedobacter soli TaxID=416955 RepID=UPI0021C99828|nr:glycosyltransferase [Parapedobacter soli]